MPKESCCTKISLNIEIIFHSLWFETFSNQVDCWFNKIIKSFIFFTPTCVFTVITNDMLTCPHELEILIINSNIIVFLLKLKRSAYNSRLSCFLLQEMHRLQFFSQVNVLLHFVERWIIMDVIDYGSTLNHWLLLNVQLYYLQT